MFARYLNLIFLAGSVASLWCHPCSAQTKPDFQNAQFTPTLAQVQIAIRKHLPRMRAATVAVRSGTNEASGVIVDSKAVITTGHAVSRIGQKATVILLDGTELQATVHGIDRTQDVALLMLSSPTDVPPVQLHGFDSKWPQSCIAIGNPSGFDINRPGLVRFGSCVSDDIIRSTCRLAKGDSGGPLFDIQGRVIGIHKQIAKGSDQNFHVNATAVRKNWNKLLKGGEIRGPQPLANKTQWRFREPPGFASLTRSVVVIECEKKAVALGTVVQSGEQTIVLTKASELSGPVQITNGNNLANATVQYTSRNLDLAVLQCEAPWLHGLSIERTESSALGTLVTSLTPRADKNIVGIIGATGRKIGWRKGSLGLVLDGLTVSEVKPNDAAKLAGILVGDELSSFGGSPLNSQEQLGQVLSERNAGDRIQLAVRRSGRKRELSVQLLHPADQRFDSESFQQGTAGKSSLRRSGFPQVQQHDCELDRNQCGGPVVDLKGKLIGINIAKVGREAVYSLPVHVVAKLVESVRTGDRSP